MADGTRNQGNLYLSGHGPASAVCTRGGTSSAYPSNNLGGWTCQWITDTGLPQVPSPSRVPTSFHSAQSTPDRSVGYFRIPVLSNIAIQYLIFCPSCQGSILSTLALGDTKSCRPSSPLPHPIPCIPLPLVAGLTSTSNTANK